uniref:Ribonuclease H protein At1g65750 family n=1 Tax=Cajanus cajan TaxID=3821 RepID=A0A151R7K9_CAJCA|nr:Putative ribonuclease H protein At1g65750 family [Cajanus cajan]
MTKVQGHLAAWKGRLLSRVGWVALVNFVLSVIPVYIMHTQWLTSGTCDQLDALSRRFFWSGEGVRKLHLVKWETLTRPRKEGGLGVCLGRNKNIWLLGKLIWNLFHHTGKL